MPKRSEISLENRVKIQLLYNQGKSQKGIAALVKCSRCAVQSAIKRFAQTGSHVNKPRTGRKRITTEREDRKLIRESIRDRKKTSSELAAALIEEVGKPISARTARRRLREAGLKGCKARKKPWLSEANKRKRLEWALRHQHFTEEDWSNVVWSDESNFEIGPLTDLRWHLGGARGQEGNNIAIHVTPPDGDEDDDEFVPPLRVRRKLSTPLTALPGAADELGGIPHMRTSPARSLSPLDRTKRRFSTMVSSAAAAAVSRRLSATIGWCLATPTHVKPQIVRQGRALCLQYIKTQIRRSSLCQKKQIVIKRLQRMLETECGEEAISNSETGVLAALRALCAALERKRPEAFRHVARQATRAPSAMLRSDTALAELALALARRITRENITWSKIAAVYCVCGALAREAAEAVDEEPALELVSAPAAAIADLLHEEAGSWIAAHGGWNGLIERLRASERDQRSEKNLQVMVSFFVIACFVLLLLRWLLHSHPAYYDSL